jgi:glycerophosphoryl diester phosphodiesterase
LPGIRAIAAALWCGLLAGWLLCPSPRAFSEEVPQEGAEAKSKPFFRESIALGAHRGGRGLWPESTMSAFREAYRRWPRIVLETDARLTSDGKIVLLHDATVDRTTDGSGPIEGMSLDEARRLDAGYRFTTDDGKTFPFRAQGIAIPTLSEALEALPEARFEVEIKGGVAVAEGVIKVIQSAKAENRVLLASIVPASMQRVRRSVPEVATCYSTLEAAHLLNVLRGRDDESSWVEYRPRADVLSLFSNMVKQFRITPEEIRAVEGKGIHVQLHTINNPQEMRDTLTSGVTSILTDYPDRLFEVIDAMDMTDTKEDTPQAP